MKIVSDGSPIKTKEGIYRLVEDWVVDFEGLGGRLIVPKGYSCDLASIPKFIFWWGRGAWDIAAIAHDYIYEKGYIQSELKEEDGLRLFNIELSKKQADKLFYKICLVAGVNPVTARLMYFAVSLFGRGIWKLIKK